MYVKGQNVRLFVEQNGVELCIAATSTCTLHIAADLSETTTKDSTGDWKEQETNGKSWDASADMMLVIDQTETALTGIDLSDMVGEKVKVRLNITEGTKNRVIAAGLKEGYAIINDWSLDAPNRDNSTVKVQLQGTGPLVRVQESSAE